MPEYVVSLIIGGLSFGGTLLGAYFANRKSTAIMQYRLEQLEKEVRKHNSLVERTYELEKQVAIIQEDLHND